MVSNTDVLKQLQATSQDHSTMHHTAVTLNLAVAMLLHCTPIIANSMTSWQHKRQPCKAVSNYNKGTDELGDTTCGMMIYMTPKHGGTDCTPCHPQLAVQHQFSASAMFAGRHLFEQQ